MRPICWSRRPDTPTRCRHPGGYMKSSCWALRSHVRERSGGRGCGQPPSDLGVDGHHHVGATGRIHRVAVMADLNVMRPARSVRSWPPHSWPRRGTVRLLSPSSATQTDPPNRADSVAGVGGDGCSASDTGEQLARTTPSTVAATAVRSSILVKVRARRITEHGDLRPLQAAPGGANTVTDGCT